MFKVKDASCKYIGKSVYIRKYCNAGPHAGLSSLTSWSCPGLGRGLRTLWPSKCWPEVGDEEKIVIKGPVSPEGRTGGGTGRFCLQDSSGGFQSHGEEPTLEQGNRGERQQRRKAMTPPFSIPPCHLVKR